MKSERLENFAVSFVAVTMLLLFSASPTNAFRTDPPSAYRPIIDMINAQQDLIRELSGDVPGGAGGFMKKPWLTAKHGLKMQEKLSAGQFTGLIRQLETAKKMLKRDKPCTAANILNAYTKHTAAFSRIDIEVSQFLYANGQLILSSLIRNLPEDHTCRKYALYREKPAMNIETADTRGISGSIGFGMPELTPAEGDEDQYLQVRLPGQDEALGKPGKPGVPFVYKLVAVPRGADVSVAIRHVEIGEIIKLNLFPYQYPEPDRDGFDPEGYGPTEPNFVIDETAYAAPGLYPAELCSIGLIGRVRDLGVALLSCAAGQYDAGNMDYYRFDRVDIDILFSENNESYVTDAFMNPFEPDMADIADATVNGGDVFEKAEPRLPDEQCQGEEFLIFTPVHLKPQADRLAAWKRQTGLSTRVELVGSQTTAQLIDDYIEQRFEACKVRPAYILLFGDAEHVPTFYVTTTWDNDDSTASDYPYATLSSSLLSILPSFAVGRIPVDTIEEAEIVVDKILSYQGAPPPEDEFYGNVSIVSEFECCRLRSETAPQVSGGSPGTDLTDGWADRANIETAEFVRNGLMKHNYAVERIYALNVNNLIANYPQTPEFDTTPRRYYSGVFLPADLGASSGFGWDSLPSDISKAFNDGRFLIFKRGHGSYWGWKRPQFKLNETSYGDPLGDLYWLANGDKLPVLFGIACELAFFDNETASGQPFYPSSKLGSGWVGSITYPNDVDETYFAETLLKMEDAGVIGLVGATRMSPGTPNNALARGLFDAVWPDMDPAAKAAAAPIRRMGDILNSAKIYMLGQIGIPQPSDDTDYAKFAVDNLYLFNLIGDPTVAMWTSKPMVLVAAHTITQHPGALVVDYEIDGARITALQENDQGSVPIGRATVKDGKATIEFLGDPDPLLPIQISASMEGAVARLLNSIPPEIQPVDLADESAFSISATRISFDETGRFLSEHISSQYEEWGVTFVDDAETTPLIVDGTVRQGTTHSPPFSLANDADTLNPGSSGVPLTILFAAPVQRVGMYIGNGNGGFTATLTAYDAQSSALFSVQRNAFGNNVDTFVGLDVGKGIVKEVRLDYGATSASEEIDDLVYE